MKKIVSFVSALVFAVAVALPAVAQKATIDFRYNFKSDDGKSYFNWSADGKTVKDSVDVATGASKAKSTTEFNIVRFDSTGKKKAVPQGLRFVMLFPVAVHAVGDGDGFTATAAGKKVIITFVHRGTAFKITSDDDGKIDMAKSFQIASGVGENVGGKFVLKDEFVKDGGDKTDMKDLDWSKVKLVADTADSDADFTYTGALAATCKNGIVTMKGTLTKTK